MFYVTQRSAGKRPGFHWHNPISWFAKIYLCWSWVSIHDFDLRGLLFQHNDSQKNSMKMWICWAFRVSFEFAGFTVDFQPAGSEVFTFPTFRHVLFLPGRPGSFVIMLLPCAWKLLTKLTDCDMLYSNYFKNIHISYTKKVESCKGLLSIDWFLFPAYKFMT